MPLTFDYKENSRGLGLADMACALRTGSPFRASYEQTYHVLEILTAFEKSSNAEKTLELETHYDRKPPIAHGKIHGVLDETSPFNVYTHSEGSLRSGYTGLEMILCRGIHQKLSRSLCFSYHRSLRLLHYFGSEGN